MQPEVVILDGSSAASIDERITNGCLGLALVQSVRSGVHVQEVEMFQLVSHLSGLIRECALVIDEACTA